MAQTKSKRLVDLLTLLLASRYPVSRAAIQRVAGYPKGAEAFHRQFERDKQELRALGFPVREAGAAEDDEGGYVLDRARLRLPDVRLTPEEVVALGLARRLGGFHALLGGAVRDALGKLGLVALEGDPAPGIVYAPPGARATGEEARLRALESAVASGHRVRMSYQSRDADRPSERELDPYGLFVLGGAWYVVGHDHKSGETRTFRTSRIAKLARATRSAAADFRTPRGFKLEQHVERLRLGASEGERGIDIVLRFAPAETWRVGRLRGAHLHAKKTAEGGLEVKLAGADPYAIVHWALGLGRGVEIVSPTTLRDEMRELAQRAARAHA
jgi:predicted DNA-binding transcriptional regulator YafY